MRAKHAGKARAKARAEARAKGWYASHQKAKLNIGKPL